MVDSSDDIEFSEVSLGEFLHEFGVTFEVCLFASSDEREMSSVVFLFKPLVLLVLVVALWSILDEGKSLDG